jgi:hypothetical protein
MALRYDHWRDCLFDDCAVLLILRIKVSYIIDWPHSLKEGIYEIVFYKFTAFNYLKYTFFDFFIIVNLISI